MKGLSLIVLILSLTITIQVKAEEYLDKHWNGDGLLGYDKYPYVKKHKPNYEKNIPLPIAKTYQNLRQGLTACSYTNFFVMGDIYYEDKTAELTFHFTTMDGVFLEAIYALKSINDIETHVISWWDNNIYTKKTDLIIEKGKDIDCEIFNPKDDENKFKL